MSASASSSSGPSATPSPTWPLTTIFTPTASCLPPQVSWSTCTEWQIRNSLVLVCGPHTNAEDCLPTSFYSNAQTPTFSPGICPHGYTIGTAFSAAGGALSAIPSSSAIPTTSLCCPSGLTYRQSIYSGIYNLGVCVTTLTSAGGTGSGSSSFAVNPDNVGTTTRNIYDLPTTDTRGTVVIGYQSPLTVVWASTDLAAFTPASAPLQAAAATSASSATGSSSASTPSAEPLTGTQTASTSGSLSTGAKAGIGVGIACAVLFLAVLGIFLWRRHRSGDREQRSSYHEKDGNAGHDVFELDAKQEPKELHWTDTKELLGSEAARELDAKAKPTELQAELQDEPSGSRSGI